MGRRTNKHLRPHRPLAPGSLSRAEDRHDGRWVVRQITGQAALKSYRCPGCDQVIPTGLAHLVVWPDQPRTGAGTAVEDRRHWHTSCWRRRR